MPPCARTTDVRELDRADVPPGFTICASIASAARDADALVLATEWNEYKSIDFAGLRSLMRGNLLFDGPTRSNRAAPTRPDSTTSAWAAKHRWPRPRPR